MRVTIDEIAEYSESAPLLINGLCFVQSGAEGKDTSALYQWLKRYCQKTDGLSFMLCQSSHESDGVSKERKKTGQRGRPKTVVTGKSAKPHIHGVLINESQNTDIEDVKESLSAYCRKRRKKRPNLNQQKIKSLSGLQLVSYMSKQADSILSYGDFDFSYFNDCRYNDDFNPIFTDKNFS